MQQTRTTPQSSAYHKSWLWWSGNCECEGGPKNSEDSPLYRSHSPSPPTGGAGHCNDGIQSISRNTIVQTPQSKDQLGYKSIHFIECPMWPLDGIQNRNDSAVVKRSGWRKDWCMAARQWREYVDDQLNVGNSRMQWTAARDYGSQQFGNSRCDRDYQPKALDSPIHE